MKIKEILPTIILLTLAGFINGCGIWLFFVQNEFIDAGVSGLAFFGSKIIRGDASLMSLFLVLFNIPFFSIGFKKMGYQFVLKSAYIILIYSLTLGILEHNVHADSIKAFALVIEQPIVCAIFGGCIAGFGSGCAIKSGGAMDGIEVLGILLHKKLNITVGQFAFIYNLIMFLVFGISPLTGDEGIMLALYSIIAYFLSNKVIDMISTGFDKTTMALIISSKNEEIADAISHEMKRGVTFIQCEGYYSKKQDKMIYCVVNRFEVNELRAIVTKIDKKAFITLSEISEVVSRRIRKGEDGFKVIENKEA